MLSDTSLFVPAEIAVACVKVNIFHWHVHTYIRFSWTQVTQQLLLTYKPTI